MHSGASAGHWALFGGHSGCCGTQWALELLSVADFGPRKYTGDESQLVRDWLFECLLWCRQFGVIVYMLC